MRISKNIKIGKDDTLHVFANESIVCSDWHVPGESQSWYHKLLQYRQTHNIKTIIIGGDFWNFDSISRWVIKDRKMSLSEEIEKGLRILKSLSSSANVYLVCGNHDQRIAVSFGGVISFKEWMDSFAIKNLTVTNHDFLYLYSQGVKYRICHPDTYSRIKGSSATKIAHARQENIIMGHQHFVSVSTDVTSRYLAVDMGCMCNPDAFLYKNSATNAFPDWENCFIHIKNGKIKLISEYSF